MFADPYNIQINAVRLQPEHAYEFHRLWCDPGITLVFATKQVPESALGARLGVNVSVVRGFGTDGRLS